MEYVDIFEDGLPIDSDNKCPNCDNAELYMVGEDFYCEYCNIYFNPKEET